MESLNVMSTYCFNQEIKVHEHNFRMVKCQAMLQQMWHSSHCILKQMATGLHIKRLAMMSQSQQTYRLG